MGEMTLFKILAVTLTTLPVSLSNFGDRLTSYIVNTGSQRLYEKPLPTDQAVSQLAQSLARSEALHPMPDGQFALFVVPRADQQTKTLHYEIVSNPVAGQPYQVVRFEGNPRGMVASKIEAWLKNPQSTYKSAPEYVVWTPNQPFVNTSVAEGLRLLSVPGTPGNATTLQGVARALDVSIILLEHEGHRVTNTQLIVQDPSQPVLVLSFNTQSQSYEAVSAADAQAIVARYRHVTTGLSQSQSDFSKDNTPETQSAYRQALLEFQRFSRQLPAMVHLEKTVSPVSTPDSQYESVLHALSTQLPSLEGLPVAAKDLQQFKATRQDRVASEALFRGIVRSFVDDVVNDIASERRLAHEGVDMGKIRASVLSQIHSMDSSSKIRSELNAHLKDLGFDRFLEAASQQDTLIQTMRELAVSGVVRVHLERNNLKTDGVSIPLLSPNGDLVHFDSRHQLLRTDDEVCTQRQETREALWNVGIKVLEHSANVYGYLQANSYFPLWEPVKTSSKAEASTAKLDQPLPVAPVQAEPIPVVELPQPTSLPTMDLGSVPLFLGCLGGTSFVPVLTVFCFPLLASKAKAELVGLEPMDSIVFEGMQGMKMDAVATPRLEPQDITALKAEVEALDIPIAAGKPADTFYLYEKLDALRKMSPTPEDTSVLDELGRQLFAKDVNAMLMQYDQFPGTSINYKLNFYKKRLQIVTRGSMSPSRALIDTLEKMRNKLHAKPVLSQMINRLTQGIYFAAEGSDGLVGWHTTFLPRDDDMPGFVRDADDDPNFAPVSTFAWAPAQAPIAAPDLSPGDFGNAFDRISEKLIMPAATRVLVIEPADFSIIETKHDGSRSGYQLRHTDGSLWLAKSDVDSASMQGHSVLKALGLPLPEIRHIKIGGKVHVCSRFIEGAKSLDDPKGNSGWGPLDVLRVAVRTGFAGINDMHNDNVMTMPDGKITVVDTDHNVIRLGCRPYFHLMPLIEIKNPRKVPVLTEPGRDVTHSVLPGENFDLDRSLTLSAIRDARTVDMLREIKAVLDDYEAMPDQEKALLKETYDVWRRVYTPHIEAMLNGGISEQERFSQSDTFKAALKALNEAYPGVNVNLRRFRDPGVVAG